MSKQDTRKRSVVVALRATKTERSAIHAAAKRAGSTMNTWAMETLLKAALKAKSHATVGKSDQEPVCAPGGEITDRTKSQSVPAQEASSG